MTKTFEELWRDLEERSRRWAIPIVQDYKELEYIFNLIRGCESYLEIGTAEGNGLYVLSHALAPNARIEFIDFGEKHTEEARNEVLDRMPQKAWATLGNSHSEKVLKSILGTVCGRDEFVYFDTVFIDAGHTYEDVIADSIAYGHLATKYIIYHDICLPEVRKAYDWYLAQNPQFKHHEFINSTTYGYGIIEV